MAFARGVLGTLGVVLAFLGWGLLCWAGITASAQARAYPVTMAPADTHPLWLVDGYNVVCSGLLGGRERTGWWQDARRAELLERLDRFDDPAVEFWVVFDGDHDQQTAALGRVRTVFAPSADSWLVEQVKQQPAEAPVTVVTADRQVADRVRHRGARVVTPRGLLERCSG